MAIPKEEREELRAAIKRTSRPTRDYLQAAMRLAWVERC